MDTISQLTLGAAVGEVVLGKKIGHKAALWGAVGGLIPDMDILAAPFLDAVDRLAFHRSFSHSIVFALLLAPLFGWLLFKFYRHSQASWFDWSKLVFWSVVTHPSLDSFTSYGTQLFWPFSDYRVAFSSIFVIDPLYTIPFLGFLLAALIIRNRPKLSRKLILIGLTVSTVYLFSTLAIKVYVNHIFLSSLRAQNITVKTLLTSPTPFNIILWRGIADGSNVYWEGYYSFFDRNKNVIFKAIPKNHRQLQSLMHNPKIRKLVYISKNFFTITTRDGDIYFNDLRYGRIDGWMRFSDDYIFSYRIANSSDMNSQNIKISRNRPSIKISKHLLKYFLDRILGKFSSPTSR